MVNLNDNDVYEVIAYRLTDEDMAREGTSATPLIIFGPFGHLIDLKIKQMIPHNLVLLKNDMLIFGKKKIEIRLHDIEHILLRFNFFRMSGTPNGRITIMTKLGKKYKQDHVENIYNVLIRILQQFDKYNLQHPKILYSGLSGHKSEIGSHPRLKNLDDFVSILKETGELPKEPLLLMQKSEESFN